MKKIVCVLIAVLSASFSFAEQKAWNQHQGSFVEVTAGTNLYYLGLFSSQNKVVGSGVQGANLGAALGNNFTPYFGLEGGLFVPMLNINNANQVYVPYISTRFTLPLGDRFSLLAKLGAMVPFIPKEAGLVLPFTGIGAAYAVTQNLDMGIQYQGAVYGIAGAGSLGLNLTYHF